MYVSEIEINFRRVIINLSKRIFQRNVYPTNSNQFIIEGFNRQGLKLIFYIPSSSLEN